jgi:cytochrome c oxidase subunit 1
LQRGITHAAIFLASAQLLFLVNLFWSARHGAEAPQNPWRASTLEWAPAAWRNLPQEARRVTRGPYEYGQNDTATHTGNAIGYDRLEHTQGDFKMQYDSLPEPE